MNSYTNRQITSSHVEHESVKPSTVRITAFGTLRNLLIAGFVYVILVLLLSALSEIYFFEEQSSLFYLHLIAALSTYVYWRLESWGTARFECFGAAVLFTSICLQMVSAVDTLIYGTRFYEWPTTVLFEGSILSLYFKGEFLTFLGTLLTVAAWRLTVKNQMETLTFLHPISSVAIKQLKTIYTFGLLFLLLGAFGFDFGANVQFVILLRVVAVASIYFLANSDSSRNSAARIILALGLAAPFAFLALRSGMKSEIFFPLLPAAIITWNAYSSAFSRIGIVLLGIVALSVLNIYTVYVRQNTWAQNARSYTQMELIEGAASSADASSILESFDGSLSRLNLSSTHAITVALTERDGFSPSEIFGGIPASFIPRLLWPDKPILRPGALHTQRIRDTNEAVEAVNSATAAGFFTELYMGGGLAALVFFSLVYGFMVGKLQINILLNLPASATAAYGYVMFYAAFRLDENTISYALTGIVLSYILMLIIFRVLLLFSPVERSE